MNFNLKTLEFKEILLKLQKFCATTLTQEKVLDIKPITNMEDIKKLLEEVDCALMSILKYDDLPLGGLRSIKDSILRAKINSVLSATELLDICSMIDVVNNVLRYQKNINNLKLKNNILDEYYSSLIVLNRLKQEIIMVIDDSGRIVDNASAKLFKIRKTIILLENKLRSKLNELLISKSKMLNESLIVMRNGRMCLPVKAEYKHSFKGIIHDESASHTTVYIEPEVCVEINLNLLKEKNDEEKEIHNILANLTLLTYANADELLSNLDILTNLDLIFAKAKMAKEFEYNYPNINERGILDLKKAKHPLIDPKKVVPIDLQLGNNYSTIIITGPNTGGKTVALKTVGLLTSMIQSGLFIPCDKSSNIAIFDNIFVDIGDEQSIAQSLSTFSSHITKIINIIDNLTFNSLVLLDELGSGTDPKEGSSLAISIIDYLKNKGARSIVTSHYSNLKEYALNNKDVINASVEFNINTLEPTYKLLMGIGGKSNAIMIAKRLGLNERIIDESLKLMSNDEGNNFNLIEKLNDEQVKISHIKEELEHKITEYNKLNDEVNTFKEELSNKKEQIIKKAKEEALEIIKKAKSDSIKLIQEVESLKEKSYKEHELANLKFEIRNLKTSEDNTELFEEEFKVGDNVYIKSYDKHGLIQKIKKDKYEVSLGNFVITFNKHEMKKVNNTNIKTKIRPTKKPASVNNVSNAASYKCDLRGFRYEDVHVELDKFIDKAYLGNYSSVQIVHGFGTGAVRKAVMQYLKTSAYVKSYRSGEQGEGLNGTTVVYLK